LSLRPWFLCIVLTVLAVAPANASPPGRAGAPVTTNPLQPFESRAAQALLIDADTQTVLFEKASDERVAPASLAKLMTIAVVFDALKTGRLQLDDMFIVSENAWRRGGAPAGGTTMFAKLGSSIKVRDLIRGAIVQSANDACLVLAEGMAGTEANFVGLMNAEAAKLGLSGSHFTSAMGAADPKQTVTARDLVRLARHVIYDFPEYYTIYREPSFNWNAINQNNRNPLIAMNIGADGLVTGGTDQTGFGLVGSATSDGQRLILAVLGLGSDRQRADEAKKLIDWGFRSFEKVRLFAPGDVIGDATVFGGDRAAVSVVSKDSLEAFLPRGGRDMVKGRVVYQGPVKAPIVKGQLIGDLELSIAGQVIRQAPVYAGEDVAVGSLPQRAIDGLRELLLGWR
jgi:D-alanyl-D-alanine carboxypeptidase (penicillin-binding protein 5/6)